MAAIEITTASAGTTEGIRDALSAVGSVTTGVTGAVAINNAIALTQAQYDAISSPDANTLYVIVEE
jgi:hypothetical protein